MFVGIRPTIRNFIGTYVFTALVLLVAAQLAFGISGHLSESLGRGSTLTGRTDLWAHSLEVQSSPILGEGFETFWTPKNKEKIAAFYNNWKPGGSHNCYLDAYLDRLGVNWAIHNAAFSLARILRTNGVHGIYGKL